MPLNRNRKILGAMDTRIYVHSVATTSSGTGGPRKTTTQHGPYWARMEYQTRKQSEVEIATRITSLQQIRFTVRYSDTAFAQISKAGRLEVIGDSVRNYGIISVSKDLGRNQYIEIVTELKE